MAEALTIEQAREAITEETARIRDMLLAKNDAYGNSVLDPLRIFSRADTLEQLNVRIDDKLSRIARGMAAGEDTEDDLIGYLIMKKVAKRGIGLPNVQLVAGDAAPCQKKHPAGESRRRKRQQQ
jgi:hypothetical protein